MLTDIVTQAVSQLMGDALSLERSKRHFRYAYASDDGQFVALVGRDMITYIVDIYERRYYAECGGLPCGFSCHILEMDQVGPAQVDSVPGRSSLTVFDLDMDDSEIEWRSCPDCAVRQS
jgi:hypothetical protein